MNNVKDIHNDYRIKVYKAYEEYARQEFVDSNSVVLQCTILNIIYKEYANKNSELKKLMWTSGLVVWRNFVTSYCQIGRTAYIPAMPFRRFSLPLPEGQKVHTVDKHYCMDSRYSMADYCGQGYLPLAVGMGGNCYDELVVAIGWNTFKKIAMLINNIRIAAAKKVAEKKHLRNIRKDMNWMKRIYDIMTPNNIDYGMIVDIHDHGMAKFTAFVEDLINSAVPNSDGREHDFRSKFPSEEHTFGRELLQKRPSVDIVTSKIDGIN
jgi:hypothetical protein